MPLSTANASFKSTNNNKWGGDESEEECDNVPLPIQTFLWRQTNPFLGAKIGKLHEASCVTLERVIVQNILHGLSPSLSDALNNVSRWKLVKAAFPHVIQCCGSLLQSLSGQKGMPTSLQKILYILHWMLLDSASECSPDASSNKQEEQQMRLQGLFNVSSIQLFVYLLAPLVDSINEEDIEKNIRLESGAKIWAAFKQSKSPDVYCFTAPVKQRKDQLPMIAFFKKTNTEKITQNQGIYLGDDENPRRPSIIPPPKPPRTDAAVLNEKKRKEEEKLKLQKKQEIMPEKPTVLLVDTMEPSSSKGFPIPERTASIVRSVSEYKTCESVENFKKKLPKSQTSDAFDLSPTSESSEKILEDVDKLRFGETENGSLSGVFYGKTTAPLVKLSDICSGFSMEPSTSAENCSLCNKKKEECRCTNLRDALTTPDAPPLVLTRASTTEESVSSCSQQTMIPTPVTTSVPKATPAVSTFPDIFQQPSTSKTDPVADEEVEETQANDPTMATYLDVAVIRALLITHWQEEGVTWALKYLLNRIEQMQTFLSSRTSPRQRSNSLPSGEKRTSIGTVEQMPNPTWEGLRATSEETKTRLHVSSCRDRRKSTDETACLVTSPRGTDSRRSSISMARRERNRSNPSLNNSVEVLSIREDLEDNISNVSSKSERENSKLNAMFYPEALGSTNFIEKNGAVNGTVIARTINQVMDRCSGVVQCELALNIADQLLRTPIPQPESFFYQLTLMIFKIYLCLGCPHGCNEGMRTEHSNFLRAKAKAILATLEKVQPEKFNSLINEYVENFGTQQVLDLLHGLTSFCKSEMTPERRSSEVKLPSYRNLFNEKEKGIEGRIVNATFKTLITKLSTVADELALPENMSLLQDARMAISFVQEQHGNPFRRVGLSALLDGLSKPAATTPDSKLEETSGKSSPNGPQSAQKEASLRRGIFKKKERSSGTTTTIGLDDSEGDSSPSTPRTISSIDDNSSLFAIREANKKKSAPKLHFAFNLLKNARPEMDEECSDSEFNDENENEFPSPKALQRGESSSKGADKLPIDSKGGIRLWGAYVPPAQLVDLKSIYDGAKRFAFLLETARPGTFPDAPLVAALLHLRSPVIARAALLLECSNFIARCNRGEWPEWIKSPHNRTFSLGGPLANRGTPSATRRMHALQRLAGRYFYQWAVQIGDQLAKMMEEPEKKDRKEMKMTDSMEDFFDEAMVNGGSGDRCPPALRLIAVQLLNEITSFLRETFKTIPRSKNSKPSGASSGWDKLLSHRRWSILSNTFPTQQQPTGSVNSINDINSSIHLNDRERRISLSATEEDSPRGSKDAIDDVSIEKKGRRVTAGRQRLLKRGSPIGQQPSLESSNKRRSIRNRKQSKQAHIEDEEKSDIVIPSSSQRESLKPEEVQSPTETVHTNHGSLPHGSVTNHPNALGPKSSADDEEAHMLTNFPWIKVLIRMTNSFDMDCTHEGYCTANCIQRVYRQSQRLCESLTELYGYGRKGKKVDRRKLLEEKWNAQQLSMRRSVHSRQSAAVPRRESAMVGQPEFASKAIKALLMEKMMQEKEKEKEKEKEEKEAAKKSSVEQEEEEIPPEDEPEDVNKPMLDYLNSMVLKLMHAPLSAILKSCLLLNNEQFKQMIDVSWKLLLHQDPHVVVSAASIFIVACVRRSEDTLSVMKKAFDSADPTERTSAIRRFYTLWRNRFHAWLKMEEGAQSSFKVPPPGIDFTLPSPAIGQSQLAVVDPPWMPHLKTKIEELSLKEEEHATSQTIMTMTRTRRKQKQEMVKKAVREAEERQCEQRQIFRLRGSSIVTLAAYEPALFHHQQESTEEAESSHHQQRHVMPVAQPLFPSSLLSVVPTIIDLLDDPQVDSNGVSVCDAAKKVIWQCIVEDPSLFLRHFLEKLTNRDRQDYLMSQLRKLILKFNPLPSQAAHSLLNYLFGFVMHYVRTQCEGSEKAVGMALSLCWLLPQNVHGLYFKDLKQTLKKEQCDQTLMITANVPSAKKIIVHGLDISSGGIPSQFPVHEDTQFQQILSDSLEFFNIEEAEVNNYFLTDTKTGVIHLPSAYVRDFYFFHRSFYPQLTLVKLNAEEAYKKMRETAFNQRLIEVGKVLLTHNILKFSPQHVIAQRVFFLHDELTHLPSFPRKSLETCFGMYYGPMGEQLKSMEAMHKFVWAELMSDMFEKMENAFMFADLHLFINVINGIMILHCEDVLVLRRCAATYISISIHFSTLFASQGFFLIMPTLLRCYSQRQTNKVFCGVVEFLCRQFYILHRKPFLLQMCGAIASIIDFSNNDFEINPMKVKAKYWFNLVKKMEEMTNEDPLDILGLVPYEKPLKALDLCYRDDPTAFCVLTDCMASCICVCAFAPESKRSHHMLLIMQAMLPHAMRSLEETTHKEKNAPSAVKLEIAQWQTLAVEMKALVNSCETLARGPQRAFELVNAVSERGKSFVADSPQFFDPPTTNDDENTRPYFLKEKKSTAVAWEAAEVEEQQREAYRKPRDALLQLASTYIEHAAVRLKELTKLGATIEHVKIPEVLDHKCHVKLGEVALALLKVAPYDLGTLSCIGLQKYFTNILPITDWSIESNRSALNIILRRLDKTLAKVAKKQSTRKRISWNAISAWISGICDTLNAFPYIAHLHPLKTICQLCLRIAAGDPCADEGMQTAAQHPTTVLHPITPPVHFTNCVLRLTTILMQALGQFAFSLEQVTSTEGMGASAERIEAVLCHVLVPLFFRIHMYPKEASVLQAKDLSHVLTLMQNSVSPPATKQSSTPLISSTNIATTFIRGAQDVTGRQGSVSVTDRGHSATVSTHRNVRESVCQCIFLSLKVMMLTFGKLLTPMWPKVSRILKELLTRRPASPSAVSFIDFILHSNLPIALFIMPLIQNKLKQKATTEAEATWQMEILEKIDSHSHSIIPPGVLLARCQTELAMLKEELSAKPMELTRSYTPTMVEAHSDSSSASVAPRASVSRHSIDRRTSMHLKKVLPTMKETEGPIPEDIEEESNDGTHPLPPSTANTTHHPHPPSMLSRVTKSPSAPLNKIASGRARSLSGFGMWRSVRRKSRPHGSGDDDVQQLELREIPPPVTDLLEEKPSSRRATEALVLPLHESIDSNKHRYVSFSTPIKSRFPTDDVFQITEQHQLV